MRCVVGAVILACLASPAASEQMLVVNPLVIPPTVTTAQLPMCTAGLIGVVYRVTDALLPTLGLTVTGGGGVSVMVRCNGTNYLVGQ